MNKENEVSWTDDEKLAVNLTMRGLAIEKGDDYKDFIEMAENNSFKKFFEENVSLSVLPTMEHFESMAKKFFNFSTAIINLFKLILPKEIIYNIISAYLMTLLIKMNLASYMITILRKE